MSPGLDESGLPDIAWQEVPAGEVRLEGDAGRFAVETFSLARYPITNTQFQAFIDDPEGYKNPKWWTDLEEDPGEPETPGWNEPNHPRETLSWYEAMAFCAWLTERLGYAISLPTEWQWQQAACSGNPGYDYPWGEADESGYANIDETWDQVGPHYQGRTNAVGIYPHGDSKQAVSDLSGNVWDWCLNEYAKPANVQTAGTEQRVLRGGSWFDPQDDARGNPQQQFPVRLIYHVGCGEPANRITPITPQPPDPHPVHPPNPP